MDLTDELARLQRRMEELQAETERLTKELERLGLQVNPANDRDPRLPKESSPAEKQKTN